MLFNFHKDRRIETINEKAVVLDDETNVPDEILSLIGDARFVLLGEASHGTREFYKFRAEITKKLIVEKGFSAVAVEADFPDAYRINRFVCGKGGDKTAEESLRNFKRFPLWMWRNAEVEEFVAWLKIHNEKLAPDHQTFFYGIDLYSLHSSIEAVLGYLDKIDADAAERARYRYSCFDHYGDDAQHYGYTASFDISKSCEDEVVKQLTDLRRNAADYLNRDGFLARDEYFFAEQNARLIKNAEEYYRKMFHRRVSSWNLRDRHMAETIAATAEHLESEKRNAKIVVWAHNSHLGDARATEMTKQGEWNVGQLIREMFPKETVNLGFTTYAGTVRAASNWNEDGEIKNVREGLKDSLERLFHQTGIENFFLNLRDEEIRKVFDKPILQRAIGVIYRPATERVSHYFYADLVNQFDGIIHFDQSTAVIPLDKVSAISDEDAPETFPEGI